MAIRLKPKVDPRSDPVLRRFVDRLQALYGDRLERVVLYGSRARGTARRDSDYDVAVFLRGVSDRSAETRKLVHLASKLEEETGDDVQAITFPAGAYRERTPLMHEIRCDAIDIGPPGPPLSLYSPNRTNESGMSPEVTLYITKARRLQQQARSVLDIGIDEQAGRIAYAAAFNAAQALIFERSGRVVKTHKGVRARFGLLTKDDPGIDAGLRQFLEDGFRIKRIADYFRPGDPEVSPEQARDAVETAARFVEQVAILLE